MNPLHAILGGCAVVASGAFLAGALLLYRGLRSLADAVTALGKPVRRPSPGPNAPTQVISRVPAAGHNPNLPTDLWPARDPQGWQR